MEGAGPYKLLALHACVALRRAKPRSGERACGVGVGETVCNSGCLPPSRSNSSTQTCYPIRTPSNWPALGSCAGWWIYRYPDLLL